MKITYKKLQSYIKEPLPSVEVLREKIIFHAFEVESVLPLLGGGAEGGGGTGLNEGEDDYELDIKVLPDRAHDAKDERGMAREVAALLQLSLIEPDHYDKASAPAVVFSHEKVSALLGREISLNEIQQVFDAYHYHYEISNEALPLLGGGAEGGGGTITLYTPPWRTDLQNIQDICDEIGRYVGYDTIPAILPNLKPISNFSLPLGEGRGGDGAEYLAITAKKQEMINQGYHEVMTYSLTKKGDFQVAKGPKGKDFLRTDLLTGLRLAYALNKQNEALLPNHTAKIFEIGKVFPKTGERLHVAWIDEKGKEHEEILDVTETGAENPLLVEEGAGGGGTQFTMWSEYPFITRDIAVWLPESANPQELVEIIQSHGGDLIQGKPWLFDQFTKDGRTSYAYRIIFQAYDRTLTDQEITPITDAIYAELQQKGWEIR
jgi:phenylalanyl-tRNA synthetase beta subunit